VRSVVKQRLDHFDLLGDTVIYESNHAAVESLGGGS
jgi:hypothetical protein